MDTDNAAAHRFYTAVRRFCQQAKGSTAGALFVDTTLAEQLDVTKLSQRVYGNRDEVLAVMAAAGMDQLTQPMRQQRLVLPTAAKLSQIKRDCGFEARDSLRQDGAPVWKGY